MAKQNLTVELFYSGSWHDVPAYVRNPVVITRNRPAGSEPTPFTASATLRGIYNPKNPRSPLFGVAGQNTPVRFKLGAEIRFFGEVASWEPSRSINYDATAGKGDAWTEIQANGILRRLGQGADPLRTPLARAMIGDTAGDYRAFAHWATEDGTDSTQFASSLSGQAAATRLGDVVPSSYAGFPGSRPLPVLNAGSITAVMPVHSATGVWQLQHTFYLPTSASGDADLVTIKMAPGSGTVDRYVLTYIHSTLALRVTSYNAAGVVMDQDDRFDWSKGTKYFANWTDYVSSGTHLMRFSFSDSSGTQVFTISTVPDGVGLGSNGAIRDVTATATAAVAGWSFGQLGYYTDPTVLTTSNFGPNARAAWGYATETVVDRLTRLTQEEGIPLTVEGTTSQAMGAQPEETLIALFAEAERTDDGLLFEPRDDYGLIYRTNRERLNRAVVLALDYAAHEVAPPLRPVLDDSASRNDVTVKRRNGGSARAVLETGPLSVEAPPDGIGRYTTSVDVNTSTDEVLVHHARWHLHKGTIDEVRYATVTVDLDASPALATDASAVDIGDTITIENLPEEDGVDLARLTVLGYTETIGSHRRIITFNCIPATTFDVGVWGSDAQGSRWGASTSTLAGNVTSSATTWFIDPGADVWATSSSHPTLFPAGGGPGVNIDAGRLTYLCTAIGNSADDTFNGRTVASSWGTSSGGQVWTTSGGSASDFAVTGGFGEITNNSANVLRYVTMPITSTQIDVMVNTRWPSIGTATTASLTSRLLWGTDLSNHYEAAVSLTTTGTLTLTLSKRLAGVGSTLVAATLVDTYSAGQVIWIRLIRGLDGAVTATAYNANGTAVVTTLTTTDTDITNGLIIAVGNRREGANANAAALARWDTLTVTKPHKFTVTRLLDDKIHTAGDPITVTDTGRYGL